MRKFILLIVLGLVPLSFAGFDEGLIHFKVTTPQANGLVELKVSPKAARTTMDMKAGESGLNIKMQFLMKYDKAKEIVHIDDASKTYYTMNLDDLPQAPARKKEKVVVKKLGTEEILGYKTNHILVEIDGQKSELWVTKDVGLYKTLKKVLAANPSGSEQLAVFKAMESEGVEGFPLKSITMAGEDKITMEVVKMEKKSFPASTFEVPADYRKTESNTVMMQQMMTPENMEAMKKMMEQNMTPEQIEALKKMMQQQGGQ